MTVNIITDEQLMEEYQLGSEASFTMLYNRYHKRLYGYLKSKGLSQVIVDEVFQNTWLKLHNSRYQYVSKYKFSAWLFTMAYHLLIDCLRREKKYSILESLENDKHGGDKDNENNLANKQSVDAIDWESISAEDKKTLEWRYLNEDSFAEIAERLGLSEVNVRKRISRALKVLKNAFGGRKYEK